ncbi:hypothetical protein BC332_15541 [Capsicum chinense]|nr:hypothetical protein BC332_15541 [Capsicum chinense]
MRTHQLWRCRSRYSEITDATETEHLNLNYEIMQHTDVYVDQYFENVLKRWKRPKSPFKNGFKMLNEICNGSCDGPSLDRWCQSWVSLWSFGVIRMTSGEQTWGVIGWRRGRQGKGKGGPKGAKRMRHLTEPDYDYEYHLDLMSGRKDLSYVDLEDSKGSVIARPTGFTESFTSANGR